jgi:hypothetical protein
MLRLALAMSLLSGCTYFGSHDDDDGCGNQACDASFAMITVTIVNANGVPVDGLTTMTTHVVRGTPVQTSPALGNGVYVVVDDGFLVSHPGDHEMVRFEATRPQGSVTADYTVRAGECQCHVAKEAGPDQLTL